MSSVPLVAMIAIFLVVIDFLYLGFGVSSVRDSVGFAVDAYFFFMKNTYFPPSWDVDSNGLPV